SNITVMTNSLHIVNALSELDNEQTILMPGGTFRKKSASFHGHVDQFRDAMDNSKTVWEEVSGGLDIMKIGNTEMPSRAYVGRFN
ncbi:hypothetical protein MJM28_28755, partial [Salmonella enterica subsp. enterica serovar Montevideo]|nr:hypothetical protein [Salmonella enterica subsp. enterica serovar Montevideo]